MDESMYSNLGLSLSCYIFPILITHQPCILIIALFTLLTYYTFVCTTFFCYGMQGLLELCISLNIELQILKKHEDEFLNVVDPKLHLHRLKHKKVITEALISKIENADSEDAKYILFEHLLHNADVAALTEYCEMAIAADAFPKMQKLGEKMLNDLALESMLGQGDPMYTHLCTCMCGRAYTVHLYI